MKRKGAPFDLLGCNNVRRPARNGAAPARNRHEGRGRCEDREHGVQQAVAAAFALQGVKSGRAEMVRGALLDMFAAVRQMADGVEGSHVLLKALSLVIQSRLGEDEEQIYDCFCPPPPPQSPHLSASRQWQRKWPGRCWVKQAGFPWPVPYGRNACR